MRLWTCSAVGFSAAILALWALPASAAIILYEQNFENPNGFVSNAGDVSISQTVDQLYGNQPPGFKFAQLNTVETLRLTGNQAFGTGYSDPQGIGGNYAVGMLSGRNSQNDLLSLSFNVQGQTFLNFRLNISSIDLDRFGGPFNPVNGSTPAFDLVLFDNPSGATTLSGNGMVLASTRITGVSSTSHKEFNWTEHTVALNASGSTNGNVTVQIDLVNDLAIARYSALDNFRIVASNTPGDVGTVPEPSSLALLGFGAIGMAGAAVRRRRQKQPSSVRRIP